MPASLNTSLINIFAAEGPGVQDPSNPILPFVHELFWGAVAFAILYFVMKYVALPPVLKTMEDRDAKLRAERASADAAHQSLADAQAEYDSALAQARVEANEIIEQARSEAEEYRSGVMATAQAEVNAEREGSMSSTANVKAGAVASLHDRVSTIALDAAGRVIGKPVDAASNQGVIDEVLRSRSGGQK
jgi:F-type H+-transporting ATPase subunit b